MASVEYFIDPPDFLLGTLAEWKAYLSKLKAIENPSLSVRMSISEAEDRIRDMS